MMGSKWVVHWTSETWWEWSEIAGSPQSSPQQPTLSVVKLEWGPAASMKPGQKSCVIRSIKSAYTLSARSLEKHTLKGYEAAGLRIVGAEPSEAPTEGQRSQGSESCQGHQCSKTTLTGEIPFSHTVSTPLGFEPRSLMTESKRVVHWTSETWWEWSEIAGSPQYTFTTQLVFTGILVLPSILYWILSY